MKRAGWTWGAAVLLCGAAVQAAPDGEAAVPSAPAPSSAPLLPPSSPASPEAVPDAAPPPAEAAPESDEAFDARESELERKRLERRRRARQQEEEERLQEARERRARDDAPEPAEAEPESASERPPGAWSLVDSHFLLGVERVTNVMGWSLTASAGGASSEVSGTDVSFLASGNSANPFGIPRLAFDGMLSNGLTLGGSLSYLVTSGKHTFSNANGAETSTDSPTSSIFVLAPRIGVVIAATDTLGVWLRGGITRIAVSNDTPASAGGEASTLTTTFVDLTLDPQLLISPLPHVALTLGPIFEIGLGGGMSGAAGNVDTTADWKATAYGVTSGLAAIF